MRVPVSWLGEWTDLPDDVTLEHLHEALVKVGFEEETVHGFDVTGPIVVGRVLSFVEEPQSNGKTIRWCQVDVGDPEPRGIVCGAGNFHEGDLVAVTLPGAALPGPTPDQPFVIAARKTYGHVSDGMIASEKELGLGDEHGGILRLVERGIDVPVGTDAIELLGLADAAVEINVTPDRGYALSLRGVAREYAHSTGATFRDPALAVTVTEPDGAYPVQLVDDAPIRGRVGCDAFAARVVRGIDPTRPTPAHMVARLKLAGIRSISLTVDISNYVMLELGQPIHTYDLAKIQGGIVVRRARAGETVTTLDDQVRKLDVEDLVVTDDSGPIGLGGVMGGASTEISDSSTDVLIEAAHWDPVSIARTARRHKLWSEASKRFERGVDPELGRIAAQRVADLLVELAGGTIDPLGVILDDTSAPAAIRFSPERPAALVGVAYTEAEVRGVLEMIGATIEADGDEWLVTPPTWRTDLVDAAGLVEEVARITGYDRIPSELPVAPPGRGLSREQVVRRRIASALAAGGATEVLAYPFLSPATVEMFEPGAAAVELANALDPQAPLLRRSLLPGLLETARRNLSRGLLDLELFELGSVWRPEPGAAYGTADLPAGGEKPTDAVLAELTATLPPERLRVAMLVLGDLTPKQPGRKAVPFGFGDALDLVRQAALAAAVDIEFERGEHPALHPGRTARVVATTATGESREIGVAGELRPSIARELDLPRAAVAELDLDALLELAATEIAAQPIGTLPAATQDLSLVVAADVPAAAVLAAVVAGAGDLLEDARLVDDYRGEGVPDGSKSLTFALRFRALDRTLTAAEATEAKLAGVTAAAALGATLRE